MAVLAASCRILWCYGRSSGGRGAAGLRAGAGRASGRRRLPRPAARPAPAGMYAVALALLGHSPDAEDAVQEAALIALRRIGEVREPDAVGPWLRMVVRNACRAQLRRTRAVPVAELPGPVALDWRGRPARPGAGPRPARAAGLGLERAGGPVPRPAAGDDAALFHRRHVLRGHRGAVRRAGRHRAQPAPPGARQAGRFAAELGRPGARRCHRPHRVAPPAGRRGHGVRPSRPAHLRTVRPVVTTGGGDLADRQAHGYRLPGHRVRP